MDVCVERAILITSLGGYMYRTSDMGFISRTVRNHVGVLDLSQRHLNALNMPLSMTMGRAG